MFRVLFFEHNWVTCPIIHLWSWTATVYHHGCSRRHQSCHDGTYDSLHHQQQCHADGATLISRWMPGLAATSLEVPPSVPPPKGTWIVWPVTLHVISFKWVCNGACKHATGHIKMNVMKHVTQHSMAFMKYVSEHITEYGMQHVTDDLMSCNKACKDM